ncbi:uncharacterized, partial [Tachysurus ichikawai]
DPLKEACAEGISDEQHYRLEGFPTHDCLGVARSFVRKVVSG